MEYIGPNCSEEPANPRVFDNGFHDYSQNSSNIYNDS